MVILHCPFCEHWQVDHKASIDPDVLEKILADHLDECPRYLKSRG